jgi:alkylated DNA repair dioxygenase AlkB
VRCPASPGRAVSIPSPRGPEGFAYRPDFVAPADEGRLLERIERLPFEEAQYREYKAKRRIVLFTPVPDFLEELRDRVAAWLAIEPATVVHALATQYRPGVQLGWHRDSPEYGMVAGVSLGGTCVMRLRPYGRKPAPKEVLKLTLEPRSAYFMRDDARWGWQHSIAPTPALRYSVTFRTQRGG